VECASRELVVLIQDTTEVGVASSKVARRHDWGCGDGFYVHSTLAVDGITGEPIGLLDQERWRRPARRPGKAKRSQRPYEAKESYKWEAAHRRILERVAKQDNLVHEADREGDVYEYLAFRIENGQRFVQRACANRPLAGQAKRLRGAVADAFALGKDEVEVKQRGPIATGVVRNRRAGRQHRVASVQVHAATVTITRAWGHKDGLPKSLTVNAVWVHEPGPPKGEKGLDWLLLTNEPVNTFEQAQAVVELYAKRWLIEEFHLAWKTGCRIEERALETDENLLRLYAITAPIAVRLLQLRHLQESDPDAPCTLGLWQDEWRCLMAISKPGSPIPPQPPSLDWAVKTIAKLAGWCDSKRIGRIGWLTMWRGWNLLQQHLVGWRAAMQST
jgi:hypothetical protein